MLVLIGIKGSDHQNHTGSLYQLSILQPNTNFLEEYDLA